MSLTQPGPAVPRITAALDAARDELRGGRAARRRRARGARALRRSRRRAAAAALRRGAARRTRRWRSSRSAATAAGTSACTPTSTCWCCSAAASAPAEERFLRAFLHPLWDLGVVVGHQVRELDEFADARDRQPRVPAGAARRAAGGRRARAVRSVQRRCSTRPATHALHPAVAAAADRGAARARSTRTLYQLEPDVKEAPGALRDLTAARTIARADRSAAAAARARPIRRGSTTPRTSCCACARSLHLEAGRNQNVLSHELQERTADVLGLSGRRAAAARRAADERLLPARADRRAARSSGRARRRRCRSGRTSGCRATASGSSIRCRRRARPASWLGAFQAAIDAGTEVTEEALSCIQQHVDRYRADDFFPEPRDRAALLRFLKPRPGLYARLSEMHDCGLLGRMFPEFQAISWRVVRDFYHKYTVDEHTLLTIRNLERLADTDEPYRAALPQRRSPSCASPELLVLALLLHDVGKWRDDDHALESVRMARGRARPAAAAGRGARDGPVPDPEPPADVARRLPARHRGSGDRQASSPRSSAPRSG